MVAKKKEGEFQRIWKLFEETSLRFEAIGLSFRETDERFKETDGRFKETDERFRETDERFKETDKRFKETRRSFKETHEMIKAVSAQMKETDRKIDRLTGKWSKFVEGLIAPAVERLFKARGIDVDKVYQRVKTHKNGSEMEIDILAINGEYVVLIEAKSTLGIDDVKEHIERLGRFKDFFPEYQHKMAVGAVAGIAIEEGVDKYAYKNGLYVLRQSGELVRIMNDKKFKPKTW